MRYTEVKLNIVLHSSVHYHHRKSRAWSTSPPLMQLQNDPVHLHIPWWAASVLGRQEPRFHAMFCYISPQWNTRRACSPLRCEDAVGHGRPAARRYSRSPRCWVHRCPHPVTWEGGFGTSTASTAPPRWRPARAPLPPPPSRHPSRSTTAPPISSTGLAAPARRSLRQSELPGSCPRCPLSQPPRPRGWAPGMWPCPWGGEGG